MRIVFFGTPEVAVPSLRALVDAGCEIPLVITQPDRPSGRSRRPVAPPVKRYALEAGLRVEQPEKVRTRSFRERVGECRPDVLVVVAFGRILSARLIDQTPRRAVNRHFALLPKYRGAAPVQWALARAEATTGVTTMRINERLDAGDLLLQREVAIEDAEHAPALFERLAALGAPLLVETLAGLDSGSVVPRSQVDDDATLAPILTRADGWVDPTRLEARLIEGRIRGFDPWPGVWLRRGDSRLRLRRAGALAEPAPPDQAPGTLIALGASDIGLVCAGRTVLRLIEVQPDGRGAMPVADALNGRQIAVGERLEPVATT